MSHNSLYINQPITKVHNRTDFLEPTATFQKHRTLVRPEKNNASKSEHMLVPKKRLQLKK